MIDFWMSQYHASTSATFLPSRGAALFISCIEENCKSSLASHGGLGTQILQQQASGTVEKNISLFW